jgi:hypothetical protein
VGNVKEYKIKYYCGVTYVGTIVSEDELQKLRKMKDVDIISVKEVKL